MVRRVLSGKMMVGLCASVVCIGVVVYHIFVRYVALILCSFYPADYLFRDVCTAFGVFYGLLVGAVLVVLLCSRLCPGGWRRWIVVALTVAGCSVIPDGCDWMVGSLAMDRASRCRSFNGSSAVFVKGTHYYDRWRKPIFTSAQRIYRGGTDRQGERVFVAYNLYDPTDGVCPPFQVVVYRSDHTLSKFYWTEEFSYTTARERDEKVENAFREALEGYVDMDEKSEVNQNKINKIWKVIRKSVGRAG